MKNFSLGRFLIVTAMSFWANQSAAASTSVPLFLIDSSSFPIPVGYSANINSDCTLNTKKPISVSWVGDTSKVSLMEKLFLGSVMGVNISAREPQKVTFEVKILAKDKISWPLTVILALQNGSCSALAIANDDGEIIRQIDVLTLNGSVPSKIQVDGLVSGNAVQRIITF